MHGDRVLARPPVSAIAAIRGHRIAAVVPVLLAVVAAVLYGLTRSPHFTARSEIAVAGNPRVPSSGGALVTGRASAARAYENELYSTALGERIGRRMGVLPDTGFRLLPATDGLTFPIVARAGAPDIAIRLANVAAEELLRAVNRPRISPREVERFRLAYRKASAGEHRLRRRVATLVAEDIRGPTRDVRQRLVRAQTDRATAALRAALVAREYRSALAAPPGSPPTQLVARAVAASSDRWSRLWRYVLAALVGGAVVGAALATALSDRAQSRAGGAFKRRVRARGGRANALIRVGLILVGVGVGVGAGAVVLATAALDAAVGFKLGLAIAGLMGTLACGAYLAWHVDPAWPIAIGIALSLFAGIWEYVGVPGPLAPDRWLLVIGIAAVAIRARSCRDRPPLPWSTAHWALLLAALYAIASAFASGTLLDRVSFLELVDKFGLLPFLLFLVAPAAFATERQRGILLASLVIIGGYLGITAIFEVIGPRALVFPRFIVDASFGSQTLGRARGPSGDAVTNGVALFACGLAAAIGVVRWRGPARTAAAAVVGLTTLGVFLTLQRSVWLGSVIALFALFMAFPALRRPLAAYGAAAAVALMLIFATVPGLAARAQGRASEAGTVYDRENLNRAALNIIEARPLVGLGWQRFRTDGVDYFEQGDDIPLSASNTIIHSVFLTNAAELGLVGTVLWGYGLLAAIAGAALVRGPPAMLPWRVALIAFAALFLVVANAVYPQTFAIRVFWLLCGVAMAGRELAAVHRPARTTARLPIRPMHSAPE